MCWFFRGGCTFPLAIFFFQFVPKKQINLSDTHKSDVENHNYVESRGATIFSVRIY